MSDINTILSKASLIFAAPNFLSIINEGLEKSDWRTGGYFCIMRNSKDTSEEQMLAVTLLGNISEHKKTRYFELSQEKAYRLHRSDPAILSSWENRDEEMDMKGGAVRVGEFILSFSGLPELGDEAFLLAVSHACELAPLSDLEVIGKWLTLPTDEDVFFNFHAKQLESWRKPKELLPDPPKENSPGADPRFGEG